MIILSRLAINYKLTSLNGELSIRDAELGSSGSARLEKNVGCGSRDAERSECTSARLEEAAVGREHSVGRAAPDAQPDLSNASVAQRQQLLRVHPSEQNAQRDAPLAADRHLQAFDLCAKPSTIIY